MARKNSSTKKGQGWNKKKFSKKRSLAILFICVLFYIAILLFYSLFSFNKAGFDGRALGQTISWDLKGIFNGNLFATSAPIPSSVNVLTQIPSATPTLQPIQSSQYTSTNLGISFYYPAFLPISGSVLGGQAFFVREIDNKIQYGNKIYLYDTSNNKPYVGSDDEFFNSAIITNHIDKNVKVFPDKYIQVFNKDPQQSLTDAIKQHIFQSPLPDWCYISTDAHYGEPHMNTSYEQAIILEYPSSKIMSYQENTNRILSCTPFAENYGGKSYFLMNPHQPDIFVYVKDGEDDIPSGYNSYMWDGTITIF